MTGLHFLNLPAFRWIRKHKWLLLLLGIIALLIISPINEVFDDQDNVITPFTGAVILAVTLGTAEKVWVIFALIALTVVWMVVSIATDGSGLLAGQSMVAPLLFMLMLASIFTLLARWLIRAEYIDAEVLCAAVCGYLLIGIFWTGIYSFILIKDPSGLISNDPHITKSDLLYFSYTTLTTTGFGDITPKNSLIRMLTVMEAIVGTFYNTIVIARFVGLYGLKARTE